MVNPPYTYPVSAVNNGDHKGLNAGAGGSWLSSTTTFPQWVQVDFNGSKTISQIGVFSLQDNYANPIEPTETTTFSLYGLTGFDVQYWTGSTWATVPGGSVSGNNKIWKKISFAPLTTSKIRVLINGSVDGWSRVVEVEAWTGTPANINWLVPDHLGTPRIILDQTGSFANLKRHDYLPFGEELTAGTGGRTAAMGYLPGDNVRQKFTSKERDNETGLDYFGARYFSSTQGRFISADNPGFSRGTNPQTWDLYAYTSNNPLARVDRDGHNWFHIGADWFWQKGNTYTYTGENGKKQTIKSSYTHLVVFEITGTNDCGAATGTITVYNQNKVVAQEQGFSGGRTSDDYFHASIPLGEYHINLTIPTATATEADVKADRTLKAEYGRQEIPRDLRFAEPWGTRRVRLNETISNPSKSAQGNYLHGHEGRLDVTLSCIGDRSQRTVDAVFEINARQTPIVPVLVTTPVGQEHPMQPTYPVVERPKP
jgi:RHS repeat-associated protein